MTRFLPIVVLLALSGCQENSVPFQDSGKQQVLPKEEFTLSTEQTHDKFSSSIPGKMKVPNGSVVEVFMKEATGGQLNINSTIDDWNQLDFDRIHTLTGPIYVEGAEPGDVLSVEILDLEPGKWGWTVMTPKIGFLAGEHTSSFLKTYELNKETELINFTETIKIPMKPFLGVIGVAPDTDKMLVTIPPRANGGNMDDPNMVKGTIVYLPVFMEGALLSLGDPHAAQGLGEVVGSAVECDMRALIRVSVIKDKDILEPQYETEEYYATTGYGSTIDEAAKKATRYMVDHISATYDISWEEAYMLCSLAADLKIAEVVDLPHMLVTMHIPKSIFNVK